MAVICGALMACKPLVLLWFPCLCPDTEARPPTIDLGLYNSKLMPTERGGNGSKQDNWCVALGAEKQVWYCHAREINVDERMDTFMLAGLDGYVRERHDSAVEV